jgi:hypothetical protein
MKALLTVTALFEVATALALESNPTAAARLLLGTPLDSPAALVIARTLGTALIAIAAACWSARGRPDPGLVVALLIYNVGVVAVLIHARIGPGLSGLGLWPAVVAHSALAAWCVIGLRAARSSKRKALPDVGEG